MACLSDELLCDDVLLDSRLGGGGARSSYTLLDIEGWHRVSPRYATRYVPTARNRDAGCQSNEAETSGRLASHNDTHPDMCRWVPLEVRLRLGAFP